MKQYIPVLSIAGSDSSGGAGIQADIKTISAIGCYAMTAITAVTAQNTREVTDITLLSPEIIKAQISAICTDIKPLAVKMGMIGSMESVRVIADSIELFGLHNIVLDPVMVSTSGSRLTSEEAIKVTVEKLFPKATLITPNKAEAEFLTQTPDPYRQAEILRGMGCRNILLKGGDATECPEFKTDLLLLEGENDFITLKADTVNTVNTHGTGCTLSSAIATYLALDFSVEEAVTRAKIFITRALNAGARVKTGNGHGPVNHLFAPRHMKYIILRNNNDNTPKS